jgi:prepilin-type N-terminal cleavage/methylation domain-containing protein
MLAKISNGFTLIELIVVMFVIAITVGVIGMSLQSLQNKNDLQPFVDLLYQDLNSLEQEARLSQANMGVDIYATKVDILKNKNNTVAWEKIKSITAPANTQLKYELLESNIFIDKFKNNTPDIIYTYSGKIMPFRLIISNDNEDVYYEITARYSGELSLKQLSDNDK